MRAPWILGLVGLVSCNVSPPPIDPGVGEWRTLHHVDAFDTADILNDVLPPRWCRPVSGNVDPWCPIDPAGPHERAEIDAGRHAVRWRGTAVGIAEATELMRRLDEPWPESASPDLDCEVTCAIFVLQHTPVAELEPVLDVRFRTRSQYHEPGGRGHCEWSPTFQHQTDVATNTLSVAGPRYCLRDLSGWIACVDTADWRATLGL